MKRAAKRCWWGYKDVLWWSAIQLSSASVDDPGFHHGDANVERLQLLGQAFAQLSRADFRGGVRRHRGHGDPARDGDDVDDAAAPPFPHPGSTAWMQRITPK